VAIARRAGKAPATGLQPGRSAGKPYAAPIGELDAAGSKVVLEADGERVALTHLDKVLWPVDPAAKYPAYTRREFVRYLLQAGPYMLPHMKDRPLTLIRMPEGVGGRRFVQFHWEQKLPAFVETISIWSEKNSRAEEFLLCNNMPTLLWLAHVGALEFHVWHSRANPEPDLKGASTDYTSSARSLQRSILNHPDYVVFDIDPYIYSGREDKGGQPEFNLPAFEKGKTVAFLLKALLDSMKLESRVKTSGKTGLHVLVPIVRTVDYDAARALAETIARHLAREHPEDITIDWNVSRRTGKIFLDYNMNVRVKTLSAPYSPRAAPGAPVSMPLTWKALSSAKPFDYTMENVPAILGRKGDNWADILQAKQKLETLLATSAGHYEYTSQRSPRARPRPRSG
jgi:bifunctional non-homologous end joining protein LigD